MSAVAARLLPRALPSVSRPVRASAPLARRRGLAVATRATAKKMEAVRFGADNSIPGFVAGPKGAPGIIVVQECVHSRSARGGEHAW